MIEDQSDELIPASFIPEVGSSGIPTVVELNLFYYQETRDVKRLSKIEVNLKNYTVFDSGDVGTYTLMVNYEALSYFNLINSFQFSIPIYILLFILVSLVLILALIMFWLLNLQFSRIKRPPGLRFSHMARVIFKPPAVGSILGAIPVLIVAGILKMVQDEGFFDDIPVDWVNIDSDITEKELIVFKRGRLGLALTMAACNISTLLNLYSCIPQDRLTSNHK